MANAIKHPVGSPEWALEKCLTAMGREADDLERYDAYVDGDHDDIYVPDETDQEFKLLAKRAVLNLIPLVINSIAQVCYVESIRHTVDLSMDRDGEDAGIAEIPPEMKSWQRNRMNARQIPIVRALACHGAVYVLAEKDRAGKAKYEAYTGHRAMAIYNDYVNDFDPTWGLVIKSGDRTAIEEGYLYSETHKYRVRHTKGGHHTVTRVGRHGNTGCPITRAALNLDLNGHATGMVELLITPQNQVNQSSFDVLAAQSFSSFNVRYATGMSTPIRRWSQRDIDQGWPKPDAEDPDYEEKYDEWLVAEKPSVGDPIIDENGQEIPLDLRVNHKRFIAATDPESKIGQLQATDVRPLLAGLADRVKYFFSISQTPASYAQGEMANLSAEALMAAEVSKSRRDDSIKVVLAELYERMFRLGMELEGETDRANDESMEIVWADTDPRSLGMVADAFGKIADQLQVPVTALWEDLPGMTTGKLKHWLELREQERRENPELEMIQRMDRHDAFSMVDPGGE